MRGRPIPLDVGECAGNLAPNVDGSYVVVPDGTGTRRTHFETCPNASQHSRPDKIDKRKAKELDAFERWNRGK